MRRGAARAGAELVTASRAGPPTQELSDRGPGGAGIKTHGQGELGTGAGRGEWPHTNKVTSHVPVAAFSSSGGFLAGHQPPQQRRTDAEPPQRGFVGPARPVLCGERLKALIGPGVFLPCGAREAGGRHALVLGSAVGWEGRGCSKGEQIGALQLGRPGNSPVIISGHGEMDPSIKEGRGGLFPLAKDLSTLAF